MTAAPYVLLPDAAAVEAAAVQLRRRGHAAQTGFDLDGDFDVRDRKLICTGVVADLDAARAALLAAARGAGLLVTVDPALDPDVGRRFLTDLARLGAVRDQAAPASPTGDALSTLTPEQRQLLELVADGASIPDAAAELYISVRTAERRMAQIRSALGVRTTAAAVLAAGSMAGSGDTATDTDPYRRHEEVSP